ncbi:DHHA1 domain-containing protein [Bacillus stercoris]|nr:DHHA1 domain-containing protein [Bacillus stercoris]
MEEFAEEVRKYDTWEWFNHYKEQAPKELNDYLYMIGRQSFADKMYNVLRGSLKTKDYFFDENAKVLLLQRQKEIKAFIDKKESQMIVNKNKVGIVFAEDHVSELGNELCNRNHGIDYVAILDLGSGKISFRTSKDDIDVSKIAKIFGGGGHPKASGAQINPELIKTFIDMF